MRISAYIICKNEEATIAKCIDSFKDAVDEIIVVDSGSTDNTIEIVRSRGASVYSITWQDDFSYARNVALKHCSGDWIIPIDSDEYFQDKDALKIRSKIENIQAKTPGLEGLFCTVVNIDPRTYKKISQLSHMLAFKRVSGLKYVRPIHEQLEKNGKPLNLTLVDDITIMHTGYAEQEILNKQKTGRNIALLEKIVRQGKAEASDYYHLTLLYLSGEADLDKIYLTAQKMFSMDGIKGQVSAGAAHRKYTLLATVKMKKNCPQKEVLDLLDKAYRLYPHHPEVLACIGDANVYAKRYDYAISAYHDALRAEANYKDTMMNSFSQTAPAVLLKVAELNLLCSRPADALECYYKLLLADKYNAQATLGILSVMTGQPGNEVLSLLHQIYNRNDRQDVGYLVNCLSLVRIQGPFVYYENIWRTKFGICDASSIAAKLSLCEYRSAVDDSARYLLEHADSEITSLACAGIVLGGLYEEYGPMVRKADAKYSAVLETLCRSKGNSSPSTAETEALVRVLSHIVLSLDDADAYSYIENVMLSQGKLAESVIRELARMRRYALLEKAYLLFARHDETQAGLCFYSAGINAMKQGAANRAKEHFVRSIELGYSGEEARQMLRIIEQTGQTGDRRAV